MALKKKIISYLLIAMMVVANMPLMAFAEGENIASGTCGTCSWVIDSNKVLTISGGILEDWGDGAPPWEPYAEDVYEVKIEGSVIALTCYSMFAGCTWAEHMDLTGLDTSGVTNMGNMFYNCWFLESLDVSGFNTDNVTNMNRMFVNCKGLKSLDVSRFNTANVTNMGYMFSNCKGLISLDLRGFDTANVTYMGLMFSGCESLTSVDVSEFNTAKVTDMSNMFSYCKSLTSVDVSGFNTAEVTSMSSMVSGCESLTSLDVRAFNTEKVGYMIGMFENCAALETLDLSSFNTSNTYLMSSIFDGCYSLKTLILGEFDLSKVVDEQYGDASACFPIKMYDTETGIYYKKGAKIPQVSQHTFIAVEGSGGNQDPVSFTGSYNDEPREFSGEQGFYYTDSYFDKFATTYNHSLATMSLCMAISAYGIKPYTDYDRNIRQLMEDCGFADNDRYKQYNFNNKPKADYIGCAIGSKEIDVDGDTYTLIAVAVRGGGYEAEWASNFDIGTNGNHHGFDMNGERVKEYIFDYIKTNNISGNLKIWLTGFSRAAATATQAAAKLDNLPGYRYKTGQSDDEYNYVYFDTSSIYAYGFATPAGAVEDSNPHSYKYSNIFNIIEYNDPVPLVAQAKWGFDRYGTTKILPFRESNDPKTFKQYNKRISDRLDSGYGYKLRDFKNYKVYIVTRYDKDNKKHYELETKYDPQNKDSLGRVLRKSVYALTLIVGSRKGFSEKYQPTVEEIIRNVFKEDSEAKIDFGIVLGFLIEKIGSFAVLFPDLSATLVNNASILATVHGDNDNYLAWMQLMDENYENSLPLIWGHPNFRVFKANCPVDLYVHDSDGNTVASIINDEPSDYEDQEVIVSIDENEQKTVYLPVDSNYTVEVKAREDCEVSCGVEEFNSLSGDRTRVTNFETMSMAEEETATANIDSFYDSELEEGAVNGSDAEYSIIKDGESIPVDNDLHGSEEISDHSFEVKVKYDDTEGTVYGGGLFTEGSYARIEALTNENYTFDGFYIDGEKYEDNSSSDGSNAVRLKVTKDIEVEAKFTYSPAPDDPDQPVHKHRFRGWEIVKPATEISTGIEVNSCMTCDLDETRTIPMLKPTLKAVKITKPKASKGSATIKWKKITKKNLKKIKKVQIQWSTDKYFKNDVKTKCIGAKKTSFKIKGLKKGLKYYVRIRAYTKAGGAVHVSKWSATKPVKVK